LCFAFYFPLSAKFCSGIWDEILTLQKFKASSKFTARKISILEFCGLSRGIAAAPGAVRKI